MPMVNWNESLSVGVPEIDAQHKHLFELANEVFASMEGDGGREISGVALRSLCDYAVEHFAAEEALMDEDAYPEYELHVTEHLDCTTKALDFLQAFSQGEDVDMVQFVAFLADWVHTHIMEVDQTLGRYLTSRRAAHA